MRSPLDLLELPKNIIFRFWKPLQQIVCVFVCLAISLWWHISTFWLLCVSVSLTFVNTDFHIVLEVRFLCILPKIHAIFTRTLCLPYVWMCCMLYSGYLTLRPLLACPNPSCLHTTMASRDVHPSPQIKPQSLTPLPVESSSSTLPSNRVRPPVRRICDGLQGKHEKELKDLRTLTLII